MVEEKKNAKYTKQMPERKYYIDILKAVAIFCVLVIHSTSSAFLDYTPMSISYIFTVLLSCTARVAVPVFVMCSGVVFLDENKNISIKKIYTAYIPRLLCALVLFACFYELADLFFLYLETGVCDAAAIKNSINDLFTFNTHFHLYYLYIIIFIYTLVPVLRTFLKSAGKREELYLIVFLFVTGTVLPMMRMYFPFDRYFGGMTFQYSLNLTYSMILYFVLGHFLDKYDITEKSFGMITAIGTCSILFTFGIITYYLIKYSVLKEFYIGSMSPNVLFMAVFVFVLVKRISEKIKSDRTVNVFLFISKSSFTIYLIHQFYNMIFDYFGFTLASFTPFVSLPLIIVLNYALSTLSYILLKKVVLIKKIL